MAKVNAATAPMSPTGRWIAIIAMFFIFAMISFVTNLAAPIGTIWGNAFQGNSVLGMLGNGMNFLAYLFMGIPAGKMLERVGYKKTALWAMIVGIVGLIVQWLSSFLGGDVTLWTMESYIEGAGETQVFPVPLSFLIYLLGAFICGFCVCMLNTVVNPMLNTLGGGGNHGNQLIQTGGALNSLSGTLTPFFVGALIGVLTPETSMSEVSPLLWIGVGIFVAAFIVISFIRIPEPNLRKKDANVKKVKDKYSPWSFRHTTLGVIGIFIYVGIEIGIPGTLNFYLSDQGANGAGVIGQASLIAGAIVALYWLLMLIGRTIGAAISGVVSAKAQLITVSAVAIALIIGAIFIPKEVTLPVPEFVYSAVDEMGNLVTASVPVSAYLLILCGLCTSVMWGGIFNLSVEGLGKYTAQASGIFMMMVVGGGLLPLLQQVIAKDAGYMTSYWLIVGMLAYLLFYGLIGSKNVNKDIPVDDEVQNAL